jgi:DNA repair exonuclease SbcCD ATPase subunit
MPTTHAPSSVEQATTDLEKARERLESVRRRIATGDKATVNQLAEAEAAERFATLQLEAAEERARREAGEEAEQQAEAARQRLHYLQTEGAQQVNDEITNACEALAEVVSRALDFNRELGEATAAVGQDRVDRSSTAKPVTAVLETFRTVLGGTTHPMYLPLDDARHQARSWGV